MEKVWFMHADQMFLYYLINIWKKILGQLPPKKIASQPKN